MIRIVVMVDVETDSLHEAYKKVYDLMGFATDDDPDVDWESTDVWFNADGEPMSKEEVQKIREEVYGKERKLRGY